jgi:hypothetical protein
MEIVRRRAAAHFTIFEGPPSVCHDLRLNQRLQYWTKIVRLKMS